MNGAESPSTLFANELACDVGASCWGPNQPLAIIDHHSAASTAYPSAAAAVLHNAAMIRQKFGSVQEVIWLVTNNQPEFDAFCSLYLARWLIEDPAAATYAQDYGLISEYKEDNSSLGSFNWSQPDLAAIPAQHRWPLIMAAYTSRLEMRQPISCPRARDLRSILFAALIRGRNYLGETSGATEFFNEIRQRINDTQLNPVFDSVLEGSLEFVPERAMLEREANTYERDLTRARSALVFLPEAEAPTPDFFEHPRRTVPEVDAQGGMRLADSFRIPTDGIYLRDPECALFKEWARVDAQNSALGAGFEFTAIARSGRSAQGRANDSQYEFSIDPERANGRHLFTVWSRLQADEVEAIRARGDVSVARVSLGHPDAPRSGSVEPLSDPWTGGHNRSSTLVQAPRRGTLIGPSGVRSDLRDDPVVEAVRIELEAPIYRATSPLEGPQVAVYDLAASADNRDVEPHRFDLIALSSIPIATADYFRFAHIELRTDVPIADGGPVGERLARQIGEDLWQVLHPESKGAIPQNFDRQLDVAGDAVRVWSERGIAVAQKAMPEQVADGNDRELLELATLVSLMREIDQFATKWQAEQILGEPSRKSVRSRREKEPGLQAIAAEGEELARGALQLQHTLALPGREVLRRFSVAIGFEAIVTRLRSANEAIAEHLRLQRVEDERRQDKRNTELARQRRDLKWAELLLIGFVALEVIAFGVRHVDLGAAGQQTVAWLGGPLAIVCGAWLLQPWRRGPSSGSRPAGVTWVLIPALLVWVAVWLAEALGPR